MNPVEEVKNRLDIVEIISGYISLSQAGANWRARCPFHNEKTPSFMVSKEKQIWHCFGCDKGGDIITFVQEYEGITFGEALRILAEKAGVVLENQRFEKKVDYNPFYQLNKLAADFYQAKLSNSDEASIKTGKYLLNRGLTEASIKKWQLGLSGSAWDELYLYLRDQGFSDEHIFQAGLIVKKKSGLGYVDRFRQRLMFPIADAQSRVVGFTSRTLAHIIFAEDDFGGKYINSPQTAIYDKSRILYGWHLAKESIRQKKYLIIVEGNMDAIMAHQAGTNNTIAVSGTALTIEQLRLIKRYANNVILAFDGDAAGSRAAFRSFALGWQEDMNLKILVLSGGDDPADMVKTDKERWLQAVKDSVPVMDYYFKRIVAGVDLNRSDHKKLAVGKLLPIIKFLKSRVEQAHYLQNLSDKLQIPLNILQGDLEQAKSFIDKPAVNNIETPRTERERKEALLLLSEKLLALAFFKPLYLEKIISDLAPEFLDEELQGLYRKVIIYYTKQHNLDNFADAGDLLLTEKNDYIRLVMLGEMEYGDYSEKDLQGDFFSHTKRLKLRKYEAERDLLIAQLRQAELSGDQDRQNSAMHQINLLNKDINKLSS
ncbi:MAG: DNA primase [Parcubacteria group bacterium]|nr:MAG: DNA primase [Parcubacteria group bacterium]